GRRERGEGCEAQATDVYLFGCISHLHRDPPLGKGACAAEIQCSWVVGGHALDLLAVSAPRLLLSSFPSPLPKAQLPFSLIKSPRSRRARSGDKERVVCR
nr:hypothetical protein [Tanacetum cinerariifolium]